MKISIKFISAFLCFIMIVAALSSCNLIPPVSEPDDTVSDVTEPESTAEETESESEKTTEEAVYEPPEDKDDSRSELYAVRNVLSEDEKMYYDIFENKLSAYSMRVAIKTGDHKSVERAYDAFTRDHPELFWLTRSYERSVEMRNKSVYVVLAPRIELTRDEIEAKQALLEAKLDEILDAVPDGLSDYEKALYFHDLIVENTSYDLEALEYINAGVSHSDFLPESTAFGCLVNGSAICSGYSAAYQLLLQRSGIMSGRVASSTHEWNYVRLDGEYYFVDTTWDDPVAEDGTSDDLLHRYFMFTTYELLEDEEHNPHYSEIFVPKATSLDYNYYVQNGWYIETYSFEAVERIIVEQFESGVIEIRFSSENERERATEDLIAGNGRIFDIYLPNGQKCFSGSVSYTSNGLFLYLYT